MRLHVHGSASKTAVDALPLVSDAVKSLDDLLAHKRKQHAQDISACPEFEEIVQSSLHLVIKTSSEILSTHLGESSADINSASSCIGKFLSLDVLQLGDASAPMQYVRDLLTTYNQLADKKLAIADAAKVSVLMFNAKFNRRISFKINIDIALEINTNIITNETSNSNSTSKSKAGRLHIS